MSTRSVEVRQLVSRAEAAQQEEALEHARKALRLTQQLLNVPDVVGDHRGQLEEALASLEYAVDYLGPVEQFDPPGVRS